MRRITPRRGSVSVLTAAIMLMLLLGLAFAADLSAALSARSSQANLAGVARDATMSSAFLMQAKNSEDPGGEVARRAAESLRENGWEGEIDVWFAEADASELPAGKRAWAWAVSTSSTSPAWFSHAFGGGGDIEVADGAAARAVPYTAGAAWRPAGDAQERHYRFEAGISADPSSEDDMPLSDMPAAVRSQMASALDEARRDAP